MGLVPWGYGLQMTSCKSAEGFWKSPPESVRAAYAKTNRGQQDPEYCGTRETLQEVGGTTPQG